MRDGALVAARDAAADHKCARVEVEVAIVVMTTSVVLIEVIGRTGVTTSALAKKGSETLASKNRRSSCSVKIDGHEVPQGVREPLRSRKP